MLLALASWSHQGHMLHKCKHCHMSAISTYVVSKLLPTVSCNLAIIHQRKNLWDTSYACMHVFWPVLKHGPRSLTFLQVFECWITFICAMKMAGQMCAWTTNQSNAIGLSVSINVRTRKMVNYAWEKQSQGKPWRRLAMVLTCKSFVILGYRGERLIELSSSWFPPKFPSG